MKTLRDYGTKPPDSGSSNTTSPTTPLPATNPQWHTSTDKQHVPYYECKGLLGLSLCYAALSDSLNKYPGKVADALAISDLHLPEIQREHQARFGRPFERSIPFVHGPEPQIKWIRIDVNGNIPKGIVFLSVQYK